MSKGVFLLFHNELDKNISFDRSVLYTILPFKKYEIRFKVKKLILIFLLLPVLLFAQTKDISFNTVRGDLYHFVNVGYNIALSPLHYNKANWGEAAVYSLATIGLFAVDKNVKKFSLDHHNKTGNKIFDIDKIYGNKYTLYFSAGIYGYGFFAKNTDVRLLGLHTVEAFFYAGSITAILKDLISRKRPYTTDNNFIFKPIKLFDDSYHSLPSGHATISFAVSTVLAKYYDNILWKIFWYGSATVVTTARIYHNRHWISDVFLGAVIGYKTGDYIVNFDKRKDLYSAKIYISNNSFGIMYFF